MCKRGDVIANTTKLHHCMLVGIVNLFPSLIMMKKVQTNEPHLMWDVFMLWNKIIHTKSSAWFCNCTVWKFGPKFSLWKWSNASLSQFWLYSHVLCRYLKIISPISGFLYDYLQTFNYCHRLHISLHNIVPVTFIDFVIVNIPVLHK